MFNNMGFRTCLSAGYSLLENLLENSLYYGNGGLAYRRDSSSRSSCLPDLIPCIGVYQVRIVKMIEEVMLKREQLIVTGVVQGVGFRKYIDRTAKELNLSGWVRNRADGSVEIIAQGPEFALDELFRGAMKGTSRSQVSFVQQESGEPDTALEGFTIIT